MAVPWLTLLVVCAGSAVGGGLRYLTSLWTQARGWTAFPWATLIVNVVGCFIIALVLTIASLRTMGTNARMFLTTGMMGGLTTYSTFDYETTRLFQERAWGAALGNLGLTLAACFAAGLLGIGLAHLLFGD